MIRSTFLVAAAALVVSGCAGGPQLAPAPTVAEVPGPGQGGVVTQSGVVLTARADAWEGYPENLENEVTPIYVRIQNETGEPLRIRYAEFRIVSDAGETYAALPPFRIEGEVVSAIDSVGPYSGFYVAPYASPWYPGLTPYDGPFAYDAGYYDSYYPYYDTYVEVDLPTRDMRAAALPEGVLDPGAVVDGFLYFQEVPEDVDRVRLEFTAVSAANNRVLGEVVMPFVSTD